MRRKNKKFMEIVATGILDVPIGVRFIKKTVSESTGIEIRKTFHSFRKLVSMGILEEKKEGRNRASYVRLRDFDMPEVLERVKITRRVKEARTSSIDFFNEIDPRGKPWYQFAFGGSFNK